MYTAIRYLLLVLALALCGCVLPNRLAEEHPFRQDVVGFIQPGITSRSDIEARFGDPYLDSPSGQWWVFRADRRMTEWLWFLCTPGGCDGAEFGGDIHQYSLIVEFGDDDTVRDWVVVTDQHQCSEDHSICLDDGGLTVIEDENVLQYALEDTASKKPCAFLRYNRLPEIDGLSTQVFDFRNAECQPASIMRGGLVYAVEAEEPYTGLLKVSGIDGVGKLERSYEDGRLNGTEIVWSENGEKLYQAHYRDNLLHGPATYWNLDGTGHFLLCFQNGEVTFLNADDCDL